MGVITKRHYKKWFILCVISCAVIFATFFGLSAHAQQKAISPQNPLVLSKDATYNILPHVRIFKVNRDAPLSFKELLPYFRAGNGSTVNNGTLSLGHTSAGYWIFFKVYNLNQSKSLWTMYLGDHRTGTNGTVDKIALFSDQSPDQPLLNDGRHIENKLHLPGQERNMLPFSFEPRRGYTIGLYLEPTVGIPLSVSLQMQTQEMFSNILAPQIKVSATTVMITTFLISIVFLFFWLGYRKNLPLFLFGYLLTNYMLFCSIDEIVSTGNNTLIEYIDLIFAAIAFLSLAIAKNVLFENDNEKYKKEYLSFSAFQYTIIGLSLISLAFQGTDVTNIILTRILPLLVPLLIMVMGGRIVFQGNRPQILIFTVSWAVLLGGNVLTEVGASRGAVMAMSICWLCFVVHFSILSFSTLRYLKLAEKQRQEDYLKEKEKQDAEKELQKTREMADQSRLLGVMQREKELMADLRNREGERIQALRHAKDVADKANKAKSDFLAVISHEIRTPMTGIMGMIRLLLDTKLNERQKEYADTIKYSGETLLTLLNDILDLSKAEEGKMSLEILDFDVHKLVDSVAMLMSGRAEEQNIALKTDVADGVPAFLKGDPTRLRQILLNLISNAIKFTDKGHVTITVKMHEKSADKKPRLYFAVSDTGIGISEDAQKKLFTPYEQADASISRNFGGTGLGLAICKRLVEAMGGNIQIQSQPKKGTTFYFILSMDEGVADQEDLKSTDTLVPKMKILVVDDNIINQRVVDGLLEKDGHKIITVGSAEDALKEIKAITFDVILMDIEMPVTNGVQATGLIRQLPDKEKAETTIVAMTANTGKEDIQKYKDASMNYHVAKPINPDKMRELLANIAKSKPHLMKQAQEEAKKEQEAEKAKAEKEKAALKAKKPIKPLDSTYVPSPPPQRKMDDYMPQKPPTPMAGTYNPTPPSSDGTGTTAPTAGVKIIPPEQASPLTADERLLFDMDALENLKTSLGLDTMKGMMTDLYTKTEELITAAEAASKDEDATTLAARGHDIKGMTANFGLKGISHLAGRLDRQAKENFPISTLQEIVAKLRPTYDDTRAALDKIFNT